MNLTMVRAPTMPAVWRGPFLAWLATAVLLLLVYRNTGLEMVGIWNRSETFAHAFVVPPLSLWMVWRLRGQLAGVQPQPWPAGALLLLVLALGMELGALVHVNALQHFMLVGMLVLTVPTVLGWQVARALAFPLGFLFFAVPFGEFLTPWLVNYTADFTVAAIRLSGIPVFREGNQFVIPSGRWSVVEACSGIRYLMASMMVGTLFAYLNYRSMRRRWAFVGVSIVMPIVANWLRAYMIVMLGHLSDNRLATGVDHIVYGWVFFGIVILAMFMVGARWADAVAPDDALPAEVGAVQPVPAGRLLASMAAAMLVVGGVHVAAQALLVRGDTASPQAAALQWPAQWAPGWQQDAVATTAPLRPVYPGASVQAEQALVGGGGRVWLSVSHYANQDAQRQMVSSVNMLVPSTDSPWNLVSSQVVTLGADAAVPAVRAHQLAAGDATAAFGQQHRLRVWQFYWVDGQPVQGDVQAKLRQAWLQLRGQGSAATAVVIYTDDDGSDAAERRLGAFMKANVTPLAAWLSSLDG